MTAIGNNGSGKSDWYGTFGTLLSKAYSGDVFEGLNVTAQSSPNMTVKVNPGTAQIRTGSSPAQQAYLVRLDTSGGTDPSIATANSTNPRHDLIVGYYDVAIIDGTNPNNPGALKFTAVTGNPAASPTDPNATAIQTAIGASNPYIIFARVRVEANATQITSDKITDLRTMVTASNVPIKHWYDLPASVTSITYLGNRSYELGVSSDLTGMLSNGMRLRTMRMVTAPTHMALLNGTSQYFTKVSPTGALASVADNFTIMRHVMPSAYAAGTIEARLDSGGANGFQLRMEPNGQVSLFVFNGGVGNYRGRTTTQSLPLTKKTFVTATWAAGTITIYFDGVSIPLNAVSSAGTAPTTAGTGGDYSIGRAGASNSSYFPGHLGAGGVFNAVLSQAVIRSLASQALSGSEANCIGAWSLNNTPNDQSSSGNNLVAQGSAGFASGISPFGTAADGVSNGIYDFATVQRVTTSVITVQMAEGCAAPTSGGISAVHYSSVKTPLGFPVDRARWIVESIIRGQFLQSSPAVNTRYNLGSLRLEIPAGAHIVGYEGAIYSDRSTAGANTVLVEIGQAASALTAGDFRAGAVESNSVNNITGSVRSQFTLNLSTQAPRYVNVWTPISGTNAIYQRGDYVDCKIFAENAYL